MIKDCKQASLFLSVVFFFCLDFAQAQMPDIQELLRTSDRSRGGLQEGITWNIELKSSEDGNETLRTFLVKAKGDNAYVESLSPVRNKGELFLFNDRTMWFFKPSLKKPVSISSREKLTGQAANGDIASTHYARDYSPTLEKTEDSGGEKFYVLLLKAKASQVTYDQIRYWISDKTKLGMRAEFLTVQGKPFKRAAFEYKNTIQYQGKKLPFVSRMAIIDAKFANNKSLMTYSNPKVESHSDSMFNVNNLSR